LSSLWIDLCLFVSSLISLIILPVILLNSLGFHPLHYH
jgi:hypothetical protein